MPDGYDGQKAFPVVLFLHGSGERGDDGITRAQVGLGAAIADQPDDFPCIAVFPQAEKTWSADSDDAKAALAALDDVMKTYKVDRDRVVLTGPVDGRLGLLVDRRGRSRAVRGRRADLRQRQSRRPPEPSRACPSGPSSATPTATGPSSNARAMVDALRAAGATAARDRIPRRRPQQLGPGLQRPRPDRLDARSEA